MSRPNEDDFLGGLVEIDIPQSFQRVRDVVRRPKRCRWPKMESQTFLQLTQQSIDDYRKKICNTNSLKVIPTTLQKLMRTHHTIRVEMNWDSDEDRRDKQEKKKPTEKKAKQKSGEGKKSDENLRGSNLKKRDDDKRDPDASNESLGSVSEHEDGSDSDNSGGQKEYKNEAGGTEEVTEDSSSGEETSDSGSE
ncbi:hypothetical protein CPB83DRAFT_839913 [Crepidotus variabilis]|uniref:Uncharacterized protein n=1 Tax=Crepidotus variabilis TaxID=179855 RepID=A0A9P6E613_9AGAR|nr:hypothetical protein CPB83DRAFT_839913 [Crepidotus variabilis]